MYNSTHLPRQILQTATSTKYLHIHIFSDSGFLGLAHAVVFTYLSKAVSTIQGACKGLGIPMVRDRGSYGKWEKVLVWKEAEIWKCLVGGLLTFGPS